MRPVEDIEKRITRRAFLAGATVSGALLATGAGGAAMTAAGAAGPGPVTRNPLYLPPTVSPSGPYNLTEQSGTVNLGGGRSSTAWVYNGSLPGPSFRVSRGGSAQIKLSNALSQETITHWHGMIVDPSNDGHPIYAIPPGGSYSYAFPINQRAALNWYHPHPHMLTGQQVALGLAGAFIVNDAEEAALGLPGGGYEVPLIVRDASLDTAGNLQYKPRSGGFLGDIPLVNGTRDPYLSVDAGMYRFRVLGGANARIFGLTLSNGAAFTLIGNDGGLLRTAVSVTRVDIAPGERVDLLVDFRGLARGASVMLRDARAGWDLLEFRGTGNPGVSATLPATLSAVTALTNPVQARTFSFDGMSKINGLEYALNRVDFRVPFGQVERWRFRTSGNAPHPVHVHGASFQVVSRTGGRGRLFPWEGGWKDTVLLEDRETVDVLIRFDAYKGLYLMHCHKLEHEDMGMMCNFEVI